MAKILSFRNKGGVPSDQDFLTDETETLSFRTAEDGAVSLGDVSPDILPSPLPDPTKDWTNQELADLFRVRRLLGGAGVAVDTLRGVTDEGDPWFVFCHLNGDVFIHMARIDGAYVLDSPNVHRPLRGRDFNELIADFTSDALPAYARTGNAEGETERRVIKLERGGKVRLHPSAMLAALIWTLFLAAEELVMLAPEEQQALDTDDLLDFADVISADSIHDFLHTDTADIDALGLPDVIRASLDAEGNPQPVAEGQMQVREVMAQQGLALHQNAFAMGLSTIAIAMGFMSEAVLLDNQRKVLEGLKTLGFTQYAAQTDTGSELDQITEESAGDALLAALADFLGLDLSHEPSVAQATSGPESDSLLLQQGIKALTAAAEDPAPVTPKALAPLVRKDGDAELAEDAQVDTMPLSPEAQQTLVALAAAVDNSDKISMSDLLGNAMKLEEFQLGQTTVMASFDVTKTDAFSLADYLFVTQRTTDHRAFDNRAQSFIDFIQSKDTDVGIITIGNEIIMIDRGAFLHNGADTYTFSWETDTGQVISMIGLRAEFQQFDLIA